MGADSALYLRIHSAAVPPAIADPDHIREVNTRYHDAAAHSYDSKWAIDYGDTGERQVLMKFSKALGSEPGHYQRALEVGAGTGYFSLNLLRAGVIGEVTAIDISSGMLDVLAATAERLGLEVETGSGRCRATSRSRTRRSTSFSATPYFTTCRTSILRFAEFGRVLAPGGTLAVMGEPSRNGDRIAWTPKRLGTLAAPVWRRLVGAETRNGALGDLEAEPASEPDDAQLERFVDVHVFSPGTLHAAHDRCGLRRRARERSKSCSPTPTAGGCRALEAGSDPFRVPRAWHRFAFRSYLALQWLDGALLEPRLPASLFYNLLLSARKPA